jgi:hypothetical protein
MSITATRVATQRIRRLRALDGDRAMALAA